MSRVFHRSARADPPLADHGDGSVIVGADGRRYLDACGGAAVSCLGHGDAEVVAALAEQAARLAYAHTSFFTTEAAEALADLLVEASGGALARAYFVCDGSEGVETAVKMAHQYHRECGRPGRTRVIARRQSYHGNTLGALSAGASAWRRAMYGELLLPTMSHIEPCHPYRLQAPGETLEAYGRRAADALEAEIRRLGAENVSCFIAETVGGATLGCTPPAPGYFARIRDICDRHGVLLIFDEVMCGMGRTGTAFAFEQEGIAPDIAVVAKGLGAGYVPLGAVLCAQHVFDAFRDGSGAFLHGHTFVGHPVACAAALAVQTAVRRRGLLAHVRTKGARLRARLDDALGAHPHVGDIRGRGLFQAVELVRDRAEKTPFDPGLRLHERLKAEAMARGLLIYAVGGGAGGAGGDHVVLAPPYVVTDDEVEAIATRLSDAIAAVV